MKLIHLFSSAALALAAPAMIDGTGIPTLDDVGAAYANNGNGKGNGNGNGNGGNGKAADKSAKEANASSYSKQKGGGQGKTKTARAQTKLDKRVNKALQKLGLAKKSSNSASQERKATKTSRASNAPTKAAPMTAVRPTAAPKEKNLHAQLEGLNSLNRNANGFFNGNDPKLDPLRDFVAASVESEALRDDLNQAQDDVNAQEETLAGLLDALGVSVEEEMTAQEALDAARADLLSNEPDPDAEDRSAWEDELARIDEALTAAEELDSLNDTLDEVQTAFDESAEETSEEALREAIAASFDAHGNHAVVPEDISEEVVNFVSDKLGIGEADGFIDVAITKAQSDGEEEVIEPVEEAEAETEGSEPPLLVDET